MKAPMQMSPAADKATENRTGRRSMSAPLHRGISKQSPVSRLPCDAGSRGRLPWAQTRPQPPTARLGPCQAPGAGGCIPTRSKSSFVLRQQLALQCTRKECWGLNGEPLQKKTISCPQKNENTMQANRTENTKHTKSTKNAKCSENTKHARDTQNTKHTKYTQNT